MLKIRVRFIVVVSSSRSSMPRNVFVEYAQIVKEIVDGSMKWTPLRVGDF
jgi:hypothetical protein